MTLVSLIMHFRYLPLGMILTCKVNIKSSVSENIALLFSRIYVALLSVARWFILLGVFAHFVNLVFRLIADNAFSCRLLLLLSLLFRVIVKYNRAVCLCLQQAVLYPFRPAQSQVSYVIMPFLKTRKFRQTTSPLNVGTWNKFSEKCTFLIFFCRGKTKETTRERRVLLFLSCL